MRWRVQDVVGGWHKMDDGETPSGGLVQHMQKVERKEENAPNSQKLKALSLALSYKTQGAVSYEVKASQRQRVVSRDRVVSRARTT